MELKYVDPTCLHFPREQWQWLRPTLSDPTSATTSPNFYLWGAYVGETIWCWSTAGSDLKLTHCQTVPVLVLKTNSSELEAFGLYLKTSFETIAPFDCEWVVALNVLNQRLHYSLTENDLPPYWKEALIVSGLKPHLGALAQRSQFCFLTHAELQFLFHKRWELSVFELLETWDLDLRETFIEAIQKWGVSASSTKEITHYILILIKRLGKESAKKILMGAYQNAEAFRLALLQTAQPELANRSQRRLEKLRALKLPPRTSVFGDPSFENDVLKITHNPRTSTDFQLFKAWVENPQISEKIQELLEIYQ